MAHEREVEGDVVRLEPVVKDGSAQARDDAAFEALYQERSKDVQRYVLLLTRNPDTAEDVVADTFTRAYAAWRSGRGPTGAPLPWLLRIARNGVTDRWRRTGLLRWLPLGTLRPSEVPRTEDAPMGAAGFWAWFDDVARLLSERQREVLILRYQRDLTDVEIGQIMGLSPSGVRSLVARALAALRSHPELWS